MELPRLKIGTSDYLPVYISEKERYQSTTCIGGSGSGKSELAKNCYAQDCSFRVASVVIDPSSFLARDCYSISRGKAFYCGIDNPISINPMRAPYSDQQIIDNITEALNQTVTAETQNLTLTVNMLKILNEDGKWCLKNNRRTLLNLRDRIETGSGLKEAREGLTNRLNMLLNDPNLEKILCGRNFIEWGQFFKDRKSFLLDASGLSEMKMVFLGTIASAGIKSYFRFQRQDEYSPVSIIVDEAQNFISKNWVSVMNESRKYRIGLMMLSQSLALFPEQMRRIMLNTGNIIAFKVGSQDAQLLSREVGLKTEDIQFIEKYHFGFRTASARGILKAPSPLIFRKRELKAEPQSKPHGIKWFPLEPLEAE